jgi:hypothetical protein
MKKNLAVLVHEPDLSNVTPQTQKPPGPFRRHTEAFSFHPSGTNGIHQSLQEVRVGIYNYSISKKIILSEKIRHSFLFLVKKKVTIGKSGDKNPILAPIHDGNRRQSYRLRQNGGCHRLRAQWSSPCFSKSETKPYPERYCKLMGVRRGFTEAGAQRPGDEHVVGAG